MVVSMIGCSGFRAYYIRVYGMVRSGKEKRHEMEARVIQVLLGDTVSKNGDPNVDHKTLESLKGSPQKVPLGNASILYFSHCVEGEMTSFSAGLNPMRLSWIRIPNPSQQAPLP